MALIEGVGDEVTFLLAALLGLAVLLLAWVSTRTPDPNQGQEREGGGERQEETPGPSSSSSSSAASDSSTEAPPLAEAPPPAVGGAGKPEGGEEEEGVRHRGGREERNIVLRLKFLNDTEKTTTVRPEDTVGDIKRSVLAGEESRVRLIFQGQLLRDDSASVSSLGLSHLSVLHCHVSAAQGPGRQAGEGPQTLGDSMNLGALGSLMGPLFLLILLMLWIFQVQFRHLFSPPATALLIMFTMVVGVVVYRVYTG